MYARGMHFASLHTANVLGAVVDVLGRELDDAGAASAHGPGGRAAAVTALAAYASGSPIDRLAEGLGLSHSRVVRLVDELEADGHITRARGKADRRTVLISLTESGRALADEITAARRSVLLDDVEALDPDDRAALDRISARILARRIDCMQAAERTCRMCDPRACGHPERCPVTHATDAYRALATQAQRDSPRRPSA
jgi:MarR family transcriptional repressor of emrRAB